MAGQAPGEASAGDLPSFRRFLCDSHGWKLRSPRFVGRSNKRSRDEEEAEAFEDMATARVAITGKRREYESSVRKPRTERKNRKMARIEDDAISKDTCCVCCTRNCLRYVRAWR